MRLRDCFASIYFSHPPICLLCFEVMQCFIHNSSRITTTRVIPLKWKSKGGLCIQAGVVWSQHLKELHLPSAGTIGWMKGIWLLRKGVVSHPLAVFPKQTAVLCVDVSETREGGFGGGRDGSMMKLVISSVYHNKEGNGEVERLRYKRYWRSEREREGGGVSEQGE